jgi:hypothetical protein
MRARAKIEAMQAERHAAEHAGLEERFTPEPVGPPPEATLAAMRHRLKTKTGKGLYALRKSTVEPVIGIIESVISRLWSRTQIQSAPALTPLSPRQIRQAAGVPGIYKDIRGGAGCAMNAHASPRVFSISREYQASAE